MKILFVKDCGHRKAGLILECEEHANAQQYIAGEFAVPYVEHKPFVDPEPVEPEPVTGNESPVAVEPVPVEGNKSPLSEKILNALVEAGYEGVDDLVSASDEELLAVKGIGKAALKLIREI